MKDILHNLSGTPQLTTNIESKYYTGELTILNLSWYAKFKPYGDVVLTGFIYLLFLWRIFIHLPNIISGTGGGIESSINIANFKGGKK